uniref:Transposase n=1 Tax=Ascaris lumbricoides TaxID=6252 RepID=A0A0M3IF37_ASCLU
MTSHLSCINWRCVRNRMGHFRVGLCARMARDDERFAIDEGFESAVSIIQNLPKEGMWN